METFVTIIEGLGSVKSWKSSKLENVDLNDQHGLIAMAEANNKIAENRSIQDSNPAVPMEKKGPVTKENISKNVTCTTTTAYFLFMIAVVAIVMSSFITYWVTKEAYDRSLEIRPSADAQQIIANVSVDESPIEEMFSGPTAAELRIPKDIVPIWYNLTIKIYLPGYVEIPASKNMTFDAALIIKFRVDEMTDKIVLNSLKLDFPDNLEEIKILQDKAIGIEQFSRARRSLENITLEENITFTTTARTIEMEEVETAIEMTENETGSSTFTPDMNLEDPEVENITTEQRPKSTKVTADVQVKKIVVNETLEMVTLWLDGKLNRGQEYYLQIAYSGPIHIKLAGLYLSRYQNDQDMTRFVAVTQMEPTDARRMVPCFDEPEFKAIWKIRAIHPVGTSAVSNGIEIKNAEKTDNPDWVVTSFIESPPMASYLLALAVTDFDYIEGTTSMGTRFRIWSREEALNQTIYALRAGISALEFYEDYYNISFPLKKQDMIALPDFAAGAMENWGLITYREKYLLYDEKLYTASQKAGVALVVAHELAHQWFGNLVTMKWWNDLWLNEGFATFMEYLGADAISKGSFRMATSHPLSFPIDKAEDVSEAFDAITYDKGSAIIFMIQHVMGSDNFKKGLHNYLENHKYRNADHDDLWSALNEAVPDTLLSWEGDKLDIRDFASKWTQQMGYPVVEVRRIDGKKVELRQKRFKWDEDALEREKFRNARFWYKYDIPIWYAVNGEEMPMTWLHESQGLDVSEEDLLVLNSGSKGFYRVNYNLELWLKITDQLLKDHTRIDVRTRARILDDAFALAEANFISYEIPLNLTKYLSMEEEFLPWRMVLNGIGTIVENFSDEPETQHIRDYLEPLLIQLYNRIDWKTLEISYLDDELFFENELRYAIIRQMYYLRNINCTEKLHGLFLKNFLDLCQDENALSSECSRIPLPVRSQVYCEGVRIGAEKIWNKVFQLYKRERVQVERERLLGALTCSRDSFTLKTLLKMASDLNDSSIRLQDTPLTFGYVSAGDVGRLIIFDYFQDSWPQLYTDMKEQQSFLRKIIMSSTSVSNERQIAQLEAFIKKYRKDTSKLDVFGQQLETSRTAKVRGSFMS
ncbi:peptidase family M1 containing protein [Wuchereria bancrofti]|uniref:Peptidase family M1 containing protein n=1 Tax=Wuchereria bancrofti TaxID=6293 RepID=J9FFZ5_WUCBA|nr:peptidase family M1 containing protein [Wuchereria bancrofti]